MKWLLDNVDRWLFSEYRGARDLAVFRVIFASYMLLAGLPNGLWIRHLPQAAFSPPLGLAALFSSYPPHWMMVSLNVLTLAFASALLVGYRTRVASFGLGLGYVVICSFCYADGKIDHDIMLVLVPLLLACSGWGNYYSLDARRAVGQSTLADERQPWLSALLALCLGLGFLTAGLAKARGGWLSLDTLATRWHLLPNLYVMGRDTTSARWALEHLPAAIWKVMDITTVVWELTFVLAAPRRRLFVGYCAVATVFHFGVWQMFDIKFGCNALAYAAFVPWTRLWHRSAGSLASVRRLDPLARLAAATLCAFGVAQLLAGHAFHDSIANLVDALVLVVALAFGLAYLTRLVTQANDSARKLGGSAG